MEAVSVQISDSRAFLEGYYPILSNDSIFPIWDIVLHILLDSFDLQAWSSVGVYRVRRGTDISPTVFVTVRTKRNWEHERHRIREILDHFDLPMVGIKSPKREMPSPRQFHQTKPLFGIALPPMASKRVLEPLRDMWRYRTAKPGTLSA